jgi:hypothetical protein
MKNYLLFATLITSTISTKAQIADSLKIASITDSTLVLAYLQKNGSYMTTNPKMYDCSLSGSSKVDKFSVLIINGVDTCGDISSDQNKFYHGWMYGNEYFFPFKDVVIDIPHTFDSIISKPWEWQMSFYENATKHLALIEEGRKLDVYNKLLAQKNRGIAVLFSSVIDREYSSYQGMKFEFFNPTQKTIKYVWVTIAGYNRVDDKVGNGTVTVKGLGPIDPQSFGTLAWETVWYNALVDYCVVKSVKIQYMDGTIKTAINPPELRYEEYKLLNIE